MPLPAVPPRPPARAGYTIVETVVALVLIGLAVAAVTARVNRAAYDADAAARVIAGQLQTAQRLAITQQSTVVVAFDTARRRLRTLEDRNGNLQYNAAASDSERVTWRPVDTQAAYFAAPPAGVNGPVVAPLVNADSVATAYSGLPSVAFRRDGAASANLEVYVRVIRRGQSEWRAVTVTQSTGRVTWWALPAAGGPWKRRTL